jgi:hypothetical protein
MHIVEVNSSLLPLFCCNLPYYPSSVDVVMGGLSGQNQDFLRFAVVMYKLNIFTKP